MVRRAIALGARAAHTEQDVAVPDPKDPDGYGYELRASDRLEEAIEALNLHPHETPGCEEVDLYNLAWSVRLLIRRSSRDRRQLFGRYARGGAAERAYFCRLRRIVLKHSPETRPATQRMIANLETKRADRIAFAEAAARA